VTLKYALVEYIYQSCYVNIYDYNGLSEYVSYRLNSQWKQGFKSIHELRERKWGNYNPGFLARDEEQQTVEYEGIKIAT
jgi:hypothetical protein